MKRNELTKIYIYGHNPASFQGGREALKSDEKAFNCHEEALKGDTNASRASKSP